jgi:peroxiredoxin
MASIVTVGQQAPDFTLKDQDQKEIALSSFAGRKKVVLAFYPLDFSPVCSKEHGCFQEDFKKFEGLDAQVLGISVDSAWAHKAFAQHLKISYPLLADFHPKGAVAQQYGLYLSDKGISNRASVVVDKKGTVRYVRIYDIPQQRDNQELVEALSQLA